MTLEELTLFFGPDDFMYSLSHFLFADISFGPNIFRLGESCSHVGGLLHKVEMIVRVGGAQKACTDDLCQWNHSEWKGVKPAPLSEIDIYNETTKEGMKGSYKRRAEPQQMTQQAKSDFMIGLLACGKTLPVGLSLFRCVKNKYCVHIV